jgi:hypothetical protein
MIKKPNSIQETMLFEANLILESVNWLEKQIESELINFELAINSENFKQASSIEKTIKVLLAKLSLEEKNMDFYMEKYNKKIKDEKEKILHNIKQKKSS